MNLQLSHHVLCYEFFTLISTHRRKQKSVIDKGLWQGTADQGFLQAAGMPLAGRPRQWKGCQLEAIRASGGVGEPYSATSVLDQVQALKYTPDRL